MNRKQRRLEESASRRGGAPADRSTFLPVLAEAVRHHQAGRLADAEKIYRQILDTDAGQPDALNLLGVVAYQSGDHDTAIALIRRAIRVRSDVTFYHLNLGNALKDSGDLTEAVTSYKRALALDPRYAEAYANLGNVLQDLGKYTEAAASYQHAIDLKPDYAETHNNLGNTLRNQAKLVEAVSCYDRAIALKPDFAEAYNNRGIALRHQGRLVEAVASYRQAFALRPNYMEAHVNLGGVLLDLGLIAEAIGSYQRALALKPDFMPAHNNLLIALHYSAAFSSADILAAAQRFASHCPRTVAPETFGNPPIPHRRLRIGYVSGDFFNHPVGYFIAGVLEAHEKEVVEVFCYSNAHIYDDMTGRIRQSSGHWRSIAGLSDAQAAQQIQQDRIDILIDLSGHTSRVRLSLFALRPAPVQVTWLGYFGTTGLTMMDYILADRLVVPEGEEAYFTEAVFRLPDSYLCFTPPETGLPVLPPPMVTDGAVTFGNFNNHAKTSPEAVALWSKILLRVPGSRFLLKNKSLADAAARRRLLDQFASHGIGPDRLVLEGASPRAELLETYRRVDVALDPLPYGGGTTTAEAMWMGVPVVTLRGHTWVGRVGESILSATGLSELVAANSDGYVEIAVRLATDAARLMELRSSLRSRMAGSAFCDQNGFTRNLEQAYRQMWDACCARQQADMPKVP